MKTLDSELDKHYGANYVNIALDIRQRYDSTDIMKSEINMMYEFCRDNIKVYRQIKGITSDFKIHYLDSKLNEMRLAIKVLDRIE